MGAPELPGDHGDDDLRTTNIIHNPPPAASDDSDNELQDGQYDGYQPLAMDENHIDNGYMRPEVYDENDYQQQQQQQNEEGFSRIPNNGYVEDEEPVVVTHGDPNMPVIESIDAEIEREVWNQPRPQELQIELDGHKTQQILNAMANFSLPNLAVPAWAAGVPEEHWKEELLQRIRLTKPSAESSNTETDKEIN